MTEKFSTEILEKIEWFNKNYAEIKENIEKACSSIGKTKEDVILLAATKTVPIEVINHAISSGIEYIGENRVQEFLSKKDGLFKSHRHFIGHLQTNKVKDIVGEVEMIESVHSIKLATEIDKQCKRIGKTMDILLEVNIGAEESKSGFSPEELNNALESMAKLECVKVKGLMTIPPICENSEEICNYFNKMHKLFIDIRNKNIDNIDMVYLSMGMSDDYYEAITCGANIVRIGTSLFGRRNYN